MKNLSLLAILISLTLLSGCKKDPEPVKDLSARSTVLNNIGQNLIVGNFLSFQIATNRLVESVASYIDDSTSQARLSVLQNAWLTTAIAWKHCALFTFGPLDDNFAIRYIDGKPNMAAVEQFILNTSIPIVNATIEPLASESRGLNVLEYLVYGTDSEDKSAVMALFTGSTGQRRCALLRALSRNLRDKADMLIYYWSNGGNGYVQEFAAGTGNEQTASIPVLVKRLIDYTAAVREKRIGLPLGIQSGKPAPESVDGRFSNESLILLQAELETIYGVLSGNMAALEGSPGPGLFELISPGAASQDELVKRIDSQFSTVFSARAKIAKPLSASVISHSAQVNALYTAMGNLVATLETDLVGRLKSIGMQL